MTYSSPLTAYGSLEYRYPNVHVNTKYYLLTRTPPYHQSAWRASVACQQICTCWMHGDCWYVYEVKALKYDAGAREFFLQYKFILSESAESLVALWPLQINSPYVTYHNSTDMWFDLCGEDISARSFPAARLQNYPFSDRPEQVLMVACHSRQQTLLAGKSRVLRYTYLWRIPLETHAEMPEVFVTDLENQPISGGETTKIPPKRILRIAAKFDGDILIRRNGFLIEKRGIRAEQIAEVDRIGSGMEIQVRQGLDVVWKICFQKQESASADDEKIYQQLCRCHGNLIPLPHRYGAAIAVLQHYLTI